MPLKPIGIQKRTATAVLGTALLALVVFGFSLAVYRETLVKSRVESYLAPYAEMISVGTSVAVDLEDASRAQAILNSLKLNPQILRADIILPDGRPLATYPAGSPLLAASERNRPDGTYFADGHVDRLQSFSAGDAKPARLLLRMSLAVMQQRERQLLEELSAGVGLILLVIGLLQFVLLRRWVLSPLAQLAAIAENASQQGDYSSRMPAHRHDELGQLGQSFNALLAAVEQRKTALRRLTNFQNAILADAAYAIISTDTTGRITSINPAGEKLVGRRAEELVGQATPEAFHLPAEIAARAQLLSARLGEPVPAGFETFVAEARRGRHSEAEWTYVRPDGSQVSALLSVTALRDDQGGIFGFLGMAVDITARLQAEAHLREALEFNQRMLSASQAGINAFTADGACVLTNAAAARIIGTTAEHLATMNFRQIASWQNSGLLAAAEAVLATGESRQLEAHLVTTFGREVWLDCTFSRFYSGGKPHLLHILSDITDRKTAEMEARQKNSLLEGTLQATADGILAVSAEDRITSYNRQFVELWRVPEKILAAHDTVALGELHPATVAPSGGDADARPLFQRHVQGGDF